MNELKPRLPYHWVQEVSDWQLHGTISKLPEKEANFKEFNFKQNVPLVKPVVNDLISEGAKCGVTFSAKPPN